ncbi:unnamed protein product [Penicillium manginii]
MSTMNNLSPWKGVLSGTGAAILANVLVYPLDIVKTRLQIQVQKRDRNGDGKNDCGSELENGPQYNNAMDAVFKIIREDGFPGLYSGLGSSVLGTASMNFAYFYWSVTARILYGAMLKARGCADANSIVKELGLGAAGGAMAQLCTTPISVISTRQQMGTKFTGKESIWKSTKAILESDDGWAGLWTGLKVNLILVINPMITYGVYQWLRNILVNLRKELGSFDAFGELLMTLKLFPSTL